MVRSVKLSGYPVTHFYRATSNLLPSEVQLRKPPTMGFHSRRMIYLRNLHDHYSIDEVVEAALNEVVYEDVREESPEQAFQCLVSTLTNGKIWNIQL